MEENMIFDTHAHYDDHQFDPDRETLLGQMEAGGIGTIVNASASVESWDRVLELTRKYPFLYGMIGVHPDEVGDLDEKTFARMEHLLKEEKIVAVGEIGLDYYWDKEKHDLQKHWFLRQLELARKLQLPVNVHSREAAADTMELLREHGQGMDVIVHCYSYSREMAEEYVKMGYFVGVGGVVTFKSGTGCAAFPYCIGDGLSLPCARALPGETQLLAEPALCSPGDRGAKGCDGGGSDPGNRGKCADILQDAG